MAYKIVDGDALDADLTTVADAIRAKAGTTEALAFPDGMASAIANFSALNFSVVGGTAQPASPTENTIWVETDQTITDWILSPDEPESPIEGMVWVRTDSFTRRRFNILTQNAVIVNASLAYQYIGGEWTSKDRMIYMNGEWTTNQVLLLASDDPGGEAGGQWLGVGAKVQGGVDNWTPQAPTLTFSESGLRMRLDTISFGFRMGVAMKPLPIKLDGFTSITVKFSQISFGKTAYGSGVYLQIYNSNDFSGGLGAVSVSTITIVPYTTSAQTLNDVVVSAPLELSGDYYIGFRLGTTPEGNDSFIEGYLTECYLE